MGIGSDIFGIAAIWAMITGNQNGAGSSGAGTVLEVKSGPMITGYTEKVLGKKNFGPEQVKAIKYLCQVDSKLPDKETKVSPFKAETNLTPTATVKKGLTTTEVSTPTNEFTEEAVKEQVKSKTIQEVVDGWGIYIIVGSSIIGILMVILIILLILRKKKNKKLEEEKLQELKEKLK